MVTSTLRRWGRSLGVVIPREEILRKGLRPGQRIRVTVEPRRGPDDFSDLAGRATRRKDAHACKDELRHLWGE